MRRRAFILFLGGPFMSTVVRRAQQKAMPLVGFLNSGSADIFAPYYVAFRNGLAAMGYVESQSVAIEYRNADGHYDLLPAFAADLVQRDVSAIAVFGLPAVLAAKAATTTIPIIFATGANPITTGLVASFNRPGGNLTGISLLSPAMSAKQIELLHEIVPKADVIGILVNPTNSIHESQLADLQTSALALKITLNVMRASTEREIEIAFINFSQQAAGAAIIPGDPFFQGRRFQIIALAARHVLPTVSEVPEFSLAGGLMSYGASIASTFHGLGDYTGRILKGGRPEDLPVAQPTKFEMVINLKTAKALGLSIPQSILGRADEVIE